MSKEIKSTGPTPCDYMLVGERPGIEEFRRGYVLCGPSGQDTDRYLANNAGIGRDSVHCCNLVRDYRDGENPEPWEIERDLPLLWAEIEEVRPRYLLLMGLFSSRAILGNEIDLEWANGLAFPVIGSNSEMEAMPVIHTAATLHQPKYAAQCAWGFEQFGKMIRGEEMLAGHLEDRVQTLYREVSHFHSAIYAGVDTEGSVQHPWCASASDTAGVSSVIRGGTVSAPLMILHNAIHDLPVLDAMGTRPDKWTDTMLMANLLQVEPQSLKALARRHCGMVMREYDEVVAEARREKALDYLARVLDFSAATSGGK